MKAWIPWNNRKEDQPFDAFIENEYSEDEMLDMAEIVKLIHQGLANDEDEEYRVVRMK